MSSPYYSLDLSNLEVCRILFPHQVQDDDYDMHPLRGLGPMETFVPNDTLETRGYHQRSEIS